VTRAPVVHPAHDVERELLRRWPESRLEPSLDRIRAVTDALGRPQHAVPLLHVTGTNGKTTTARVIDDVLRGSGLRVGRYTSPHLEAMRERIVIDGAPLAVREEPRDWVDASHNPAGMAATVAAIRELPSVDRLVVVLPAVDGKDADGMLAAIGGSAAEVIVTENTSPRRMPAAVLAARAAEVLGTERVTVEPELPRADRSALRHGHTGGGRTAVLITGSVVTAGEARALLRTGPSK
jgi:dihydrofolate synthase/folylpolyglutamate synthase